MILMQFVLDKSVFQHISAVNIDMYQCNISLAMSSFIQSNNCLLVCGGAVCLAMLIDGDTSFATHPRTS